MRLMHAIRNPRAFTATATRSHTAGFCRLRVRNSQGLAVNAGFGGRVAQQLAQHSIHTATDLQPVAPAALRALCPSLTEASATTLLQYAHGDDPMPPRARPPPKTLSLQMTLTPVPLPMHPSAAGPSATAAPAAAGGGDDRMLLPLHLLADDAAARMQSLLHVMLRDLLGRVWQDRFAPFEPFAVPQPLKCTGCVTATTHLCRSCMATPLAPALPLQHSSVAAGAATNRCAAPLIHRHLCRPCLHPPPIRVATPTTRTTSGAFNGSTTHPTGPPPAACHGTAMRRPHACVMHTLLCMQRDAGPVADEPDPACPHQRPHRRRARAYPPLPAVRRRVCVRSDSGAARARRRERRRGSWGGYSGSIRAQWRRGGAAGGRHTPARAAHGCGHVPGVAPCNAAMAPPLVRHDARPWRSSHRCTPPITLCRCHACRLPENMVRRCGISWCELLWWKGTYSHLGSLHVRKQACVARGVEVRGWPVWGTLALAQLSCSTNCLECSGSSLRTPQWTPAKSQPAIQHRLPKSHSLLVETVEHGLSSTCNDRVCAPVCL